jgi:hypothetical protein
MKRARSSGIIVPTPDTPANAFERSFQNTTEAAEQLRTCATRIESIAYDLAGIESPVRVAMLMHLSRDLEGMARRIADPSSLELRLMPEPQMLRQRATMKADYKGGNSAIKASGT